MDVGRGVTINISPFLLNDNASVYFSVCELGISIRNLDSLTIGMVNDMFMGNKNDGYKGWRPVATQENFDRF